jgi:hypothetical protein
MNCFSACSLAPHHVLGGRRCLEHPLRVAAAAQHRRHRVLHSADVARRGEPSEFGVRAAELAAHPLGPCHRRLGSALGVGEQHQLATVLPG